MAGDDNARLREVAVGAVSVLVPVRRVVRRVDGFAMPLLVFLLAVLFVAAFSASAASDARFSVFDDDECATTSTRPLAPCAAKRFYSSVPKTPLRWASMPTAGEDVSQ